MCKFIKYILWYFLIIFSEESYHNGLWSVSEIQSATLCSYSCAQKGNTFQKYLLCFNTVHIFIYWYHFIVILKTDNLLSHIQVEIDQLSVLYVKYLCQNSQHHLSNAPTVHINLKIQCPPNPTLRIVSWHSSLCHVSLC